MEKIATKPPLCVLIGPTAVGKTKMSIEIAKKYHAEIISGDSMQVYRGMNIGTAKASWEEQIQVPHHLIDICEPEQAFSAADYQVLAKMKIADIASRQKLPMIVGGTGLYIESVCYDYQFSSAGHDAGFRLEQEAYAKRYGDEALHQRLLEIDPISAKRLHPNDRRRIIRSLEIAYVSGSTHSNLLAAQKKNCPYDLCIIGLQMERSLLYTRVEQRIDHMLRIGLLKEVENLLERACPRDASSMQALGYKELIGYLDGNYSYDEAIDLLKKNTRHYVKRQCSWFNHMDDINWIDVSDSTKFTTHFQLISDIINVKLPNLAVSN